MKRFFSSIFFVFIILAVVYAKVPQNKKMYVMAKNVSFKESPTFFSPSAGELFYGESVYILSEENSWVQIVTVRNNELRGWVQKSSLTSKKIVLNRGGASSVSASADELALAGKGFSRDVEDVFKTEKRLDYSVIDSMESFSIGFDDLRNFIISGSLEGAYR